MAEVGLTPFLHQTVLGASSVNCLGPGTQGSRSQPGDAGVKQDCPPFLGSGSPALNSRGSSLPPVTSSKTCFIYPRVLGGVPLTFRGVIPCAAPTGEHSTTPSLLL